MILGDRLPVVAPDTESSRFAGRARRAVDVVDLRLGDAQVVAERRICCLRRAQLGFRDDRHALEVFERADRLDVDAGIVPFAAVERRGRVRVPHHLAQAHRDRGVALVGRHRLAHRMPVALVERRNVSGVVARRERPGLHASGDRRCVHSVTSPARRRRSASSHALSG